ncbi:hypothetical protein [Crateriforma conspicua]|uniref:hypothetical protein n=1 Tax=Crateriforma conspicua TaxID=2527996 RepID=UPI00118810F4|nr:hypothetical protein [Crateriforma conspicua]QDV66265.1 hypothetical protein Mal65_54410 [Crateriforma conspicua]
MNWFGPSGSCGCCGCVRGQHFKVTLHGLTYTRTVYPPPMTSTSGEQTFDASDTRCEIVAAFPAKTIANVDYNGDGIIDESDGVISCELNVYITWSATGVFVISLEFIGEAYTGDLIELTDIGLGNHADTVTWNHTSPPYTTEVSYDFTVELLP